MAKQPKKHFDLSKDNLFPFILILPLLFLPPFFRGLFFDTESLVAYLYASLLLIAYVLYKKEYWKISFSLMEFAFIGFVAAWFLAIFGALDPREAVGDSLRNLNYLLVFFIIAGLAVTLKQMKMAIWSFFFAGMGVALAGIGTAYGTFWFNGAYVDGLINSTLQYHNAAAIYLMACGILGLYLSSVSEKAWVRYGVSAGNFLIMLTAFGAGSRGAMLMGPIAFALYLVGVPGLRGKSVISLIAITIPFGLLSSKLLSFNDLSLPWLFLLVGMGLAALIHLGLERGIEKVSSKIDSKQIWIGAAVVLLLIGAVLFIFSEEIMPQGLSERLHNFNLQQGSVQERFYFYKDAAKIIQDYPVLGTGGGGWNAVYRQYQGYLYHSTEVHNHPLQVWVETGTVGFVFFVLLWIGGFVSVIRVMRSEIPIEYRALSWTAFCAAVALGLHSLIDFSLSEGAVSMLLWSQFGLIRASERLGKKSRKVIAEFKPSIRNAVGISIGAAFFISSLLLLIGDRYSIAASKALQAGAIDEGRLKLEKAVKFDPINAKLRGQLAQVYAYQAAQGKNIYLNENAYQEAKKAVELNETSTEMHWSAAQAAAGTGRLEEMVKHAEAAVELAPLVTANYENLARIYLNAGKRYYNSKNMEKATEYLEKVIGVPAQMESLWNNKSDLEKRLWKGQPLNKPSDNLKEYIKEAEDLLKKL